MMVAGFLLRNIPVIGIAGNISSVWSSTLRYTVLVIILIRGGMSLEIKQLWSLKLTLTALALVSRSSRGWGGWNYCYILSWNAVAVGPYARVSFFSVFFFFFFFFFFF